MNHHRFIVADRGPPDPILVRYPGSDAATSLLAYILCLHGRVPEKYELWSMNAQVAIFSRSNTFLASNSESLINLRHANLSLFVSLSP